MRAAARLRYRNTMHGPAPTNPPPAGEPDAAPAADLAEAVRQLRRGAVLVVGDAMLDRYVYGRVSRMSPEAPVPVLAVEREVALPGGAGNVVRNLTALGAAVAFVSVVGDDQAGSDLTGLIGGQPGVEPWLLVEGGRATTTKTRFVAAGQHMLRADHEQLAAVQPRLADRLVRIASDAIAATAVMVLSDYAKGTLAGDVPARLIAAARSAGRKVVAAPRGADAARYAGAELVLLSTAELAVAAGMPAGTEGEAAAAAASLRAAHEFGAVIVLRGESGVILVEESGAAQHWPTDALETIDWSGAGDAVLAVAACGLATGLPLPTVARLGALAAGIVVGKSGIAVVREDEFIEALVPGRLAARKLASRAQAVERVERWRRDGFRVGFLTGDIAAAHPQLFDESRTWCDRLVVGIAETAANSGADPQAAEKAAALGAVDLVVRYGADAVLDLIRLLRPDVLVQDPANGSDTVAAGGEMLQEWGGTVRKAEPSPVA